MQTGRPPADSDLKKCFCAICFWPNDLKIGKCDTKVMSHSVSKDYYTQISDASDLYHPGS